LPWNVLLDGTRFPGPPGARGIIFKETAMHTETIAGRNAALLLPAETAADLMTPNPVSIPAGALVGEAVVLLTERGFSAAPVIDEAGRPVGVISRTDILVHDRESDGARGSCQSQEVRAGVARDAARLHHEGFQVRSVDRTCVRDIMTPTVLCVTPETPANRVVQQLLRLNVRRLFVVDEGGVLIGVISAVDVLRHLRF
jgi:CBS domain-containing protein